MSATFVEARPIDSDWIGWLRHRLAPTRARNIRTAIIVAGAVLCVIISMTLQVPQLATSAYMVFFASKETKLLTKNTGLGGIIALTIGIGATLLLYKFTYAHRPNAPSRLPASAFIKQERAPHPYRPGRHSTTPRVCPAPLGVSRREENHARAAGTPR